MSQSVDDMNGMPCKDMQQIIIKNLINQNHLGNLATEPKFAFDDAFNYISAPANILPTNDLSLLAILNSPICKWWIGHQAATRSGGFLEYKPMYVGEIPIPKVTAKEKSPIIDLVQKIITNPDGPNVSKLEDEINEMVYKILRPHPGRNQNCGWSISNY